MSSLGDELGSDIASQYVLYQFVCLVIEVEHHQMSKYTFVIIS